MSIPASPLRLPNFSAPFPKHKPYVLQAEEGETLVMIGGGAYRYLATKEETSDAFGLFQSRSNQGDRVIAHFHRGACDTWLVVKGAIRSWAGNQSRILHSGDFALVPPGIVHSFEVISPDSEFLGVISPGNWVEFFKLAGSESKAYPAFKGIDDGHIDVGLIIEAIKAGHDVVPCPTYSYPDLNQGADNILPDNETAYYLRADTGPMYVLNGQTCRPLARTIHSDGHFAICTIGAVGSITTYPTFVAARKPLEAGPFKGGKMLKFTAGTNVLFRAIEGIFDFELVGEDGHVVKDTITCSESIMVTAGTAFRYQVRSAYGRMYSFAGPGGGIEEVFIAAGRLADPREATGEVIEDDVGEDILRKAIEVAKMASV